MTDKVQVDRAYLEGLERLVVACREADPPMSVWKVLDAIPPKPEELIEMEGWDVKGQKVGSGYWAQWRRGDMTIFGPARTTKDEAIRAGNAMLREIAMKVKP